MPVLAPILKSSPVIKREARPILTKDDIPYEASLIFNAGVAKFAGKYVMVFRNARQAIPLSCSGTASTILRRCRRLTLA